MHTINQFYQGCSCHLHPGGAPQMMQIGTGK